MPNYSSGDVSVQVLAGGRAAGVPDGVSAVRPRRGQLQRHAARPQEGLGSGVLTRHDQTASCNNSVSVIENIIECEA